MAVAELPRVRTELGTLLMIPFLTPHPVQANGQFAGHRHGGDGPLTTHCQAHELTCPHRVTPYGDLRCLDQQKTQQGIALLADVS